MWGGCTDLFPLVLWAAAPAGAHLSANGIGIFYLGTMDNTFWEPDYSCETSIESDSVLFLQDLTHSRCSINIL